MPHVRPSLNSTLVTSRPRVANLNFLYASNRPVIIPIGHGALTGCSTLTGAPARPPVLGGLSRSRTAPRRSGSRGAKGGRVNDIEAFSPRRSDLASHSMHAPACPSRHRKRLRLPIVRGGGQDVNRVAVCSRTRRSSKIVRILSALASCGGAKPRVRRGKGAAPAEPDHAIVRPVSPPVARYECDVTGLVVSPTPSRKFSCARRDRDFLPASCFRPTPRASGYRQP